MILSETALVALKERIQSQLWRRRAMNSLPLDPLVAQTVTVPSDIAESQPEDRFEVVPLGDQPEDEPSWRMLFARYTGTSTANSSPWYRCLSILRAHGAVVCVIEKYYVCLDYKSEVISFYSLLDASQRSIATRLHFFKVNVSSDEVTDLVELQKKSYLGYIVCRSGGLPLVGRTMIRPPDDMKISASVDETVHFFGQRLEIAAVPFMQQDAKFAVCSQVAIWVAHYSAYRRGIAQRRLIAEIVELSTQLHPLTPRVSGGLRSWEVPELLQKAGLQGVIYYTPSTGMSDYPRIRYDTMEDGASAYQAVVDAFGDDGMSDFRSPDHVVNFAYDAARTAAENDGAPEREQQRDAVRRLLDSIFYYLFEPYVRSRLPVYCATEDHAFALVGLRRSEHGVSFYVHDDQYGPYLATPTLLECSRDVLRGQCEHPDTPIPPRAVNEDLVFADKSVPDLLAEIISGATDVDYSVLTFVVPTPSRLVMSPSVADDNARAIFDGIPEWMSRRTVMMGIDYKQTRFDYLQDRGDISGCRVIGNLHLAEWVIVVEGYQTADDTESVWEIVYDGTTGGGECVIQLARLETTVVVSHPLSADGPVSEVSTLDSGRLPFVVVPPRVGKNT